jgi:DNA-directed RNA polymerase subunit E'/Rpb7
MEKRTKSLKSLIRTNSNNGNITINLQGQNKSKSSTSQVTDIQIAGKSKKLQKDGLQKINEDSVDSTTSDSSEIINKLINLNELVYPCKDEVLYTRVILYPHQMNNDIYINLKNNLVEDVEGKCIRDGYVIKVYKILEYTNGIVEPENFTGSAVYNVKYLANICTILKDTTIVCKISSYIPNANFALADFGNMVKIIFTKNERDLNTKAFTLLNDKNIVHIATQKKLNINDYVKLQIKSIKFYHNDTIIKCMGYLYDIATVEEIAKYSFSDNNVIQKSDEIKTNIYFNEDIEVEEENINKSVIKSDKNNTNEI